MQITATLETNTDDGESDTDDGEGNDDGESDHHECANESRLSTAGRASPSHCLSSNRLDLIY